MPDAATCLILDDDATLAQPVPNAIGQRPLFGRPQLAADLQQQVDEWLGGGLNRGAGFGGQVEAQHASQLAQRLLERRQLARGSGLSLPRRARRRLISAARSNKTPSAPGVLKSSSISVTKRSRAALAASLAPGGALPEASAGGRSAPGAGASAAARNRASPRPAAASASSRKASGER